ncbi:helix-turn-helix domain-containing protein [Streptomyces luteolus]|uniref:Helix-turn-helix transcriptional regulator n=1 Tax=Streptomyces luteolus TaxID=3043615 RepID=A0ABT6SV21_9ACTN|nr:helix-turn-helix transcriptional regulator [Streptomyces sp. B-S-A12]MDI3419451.1 helix-turn-helix transcriptional regulator [Streptomyces sp. B-S-A12]
MSVDEAGSGVLLAFGRQLKRFREWKGMDRAQLGSLTGYSAATIASFEQGRRIPPARFISQADEAVGAHGVLVEMTEEVERAQYPAFFRDAARLEAKAVELHVYATQGVPGLLQTEEHALAVCRLWRPLLDEGGIGDRVAARLARQAIFSRRPVPHVSFVIEEGVLHRKIGGHDAWRGQLEQIMLVAQKRNVEVQIMPLDRGEHAGLAGPFTLMETGDGRRIAYAEVQSDSRLYTERCRVRELEATYGVLRAQAITPEESLCLIERLLREA